MRFFILVALCFLPSAFTVAQPSGIDVGQRAPEFTLSYATRDSVSRVPLSLTELTSKGSVVLAFYPADWSGGCTREVCSFRDNFADLQSLDAQILGISGDYVWSHHAWAKHHDLPFRLLSDHDHAVAKTYDSYNERSGYNRRTIFVIDRSGIIRYRNLQYSVADSKDFERLKEELAKIR